VQKNIANFFMKILEEFPEDSIFNSYAFADHNERFHKIPFSQGGKHENQRDLFIPHAVSGIATFFCEEFIRATSSE